MSPKKKLTLIITGAAILALVIALVLCVYAPKNIYSGVKAAGVNLGGMSVTEATEALDKAYGKRPQGGELSLVLASKPRSLDTKDFDVSFSNAETAQKAFEYGRSGGFFKRLSSVLSSLFKGHNIPMEYNYDGHKLASKLSELMEGTGTPVTEYSYEIKDSKFYLTNGTPGDIPDIDAVTDEILNTLGNYNFSEKLVFEKQERLPKDIDVNELYIEVHNEPQDAYYELEGKEVYVVPAVYGVDFDKTEAAKIIKENKDYGQTYTIPATITSPEVTTEDAQAKLFAKKLSSYRTNYNSGDVSRSENIALAAQLLNNTVLMPGDVFSYNGTLGERTEDAGFKIAHVYMNNEVVDGIGGGICQVSSTLYCSVLYANLEVVERVNHQLPVSYVPLGQDATVDYGNIDFKFKNNTPYPLKIVASAGGGTVYIELLGYKDIDEKVEIIPIRTGIIEPKIEEEPDPTLPLGEKKEKKAGSPGSVVETFKAVTSNGKTGEKTLVSKSTYAAVKTIMSVGTGPAKEIEKPEPEKPADTHQQEIIPPAAEEDVLGGEIIVE
ncbi:MAG: VanW family protein [Clostridia bacterium]|nr:VanW family protein [Clostridia bacterium]